MGAKSYDGSLIYDTEIDTSGFEEGSAQIEDKAEKTGDTIKKKAKETSDEVKKKTKETVDDFEKKSQDTEQKTKQRTKRTSDDLKKSCQETKDNLDSLNKTAKAVFLTVATVGTGILAMGINYNAQMESYQTSFEVMTGSAEKAAETVERLKQMGAATPFEMPQLAETTQLLMNYGFTADEAINKMMMLGDISQGNADKLGRVAMAYGQMSSAGKVSLEDVKQMIEAGFNPLQEISQATGESMESLYNRISKGTISVDEITASMKRATSQGGKYYQSMEKQSKTLQGQWSTLKDKFSELTGKMASDITEKLTDTVLPKLIEWVEKFCQAWEDGSLQNAIGDIVTALATLGTAVAMVNLLVFINDIQNVVKKTKEFTAATKAGAAAQKIMNAELLKSPWAIAIAALATLVVGLATYLATHRNTANSISEDFKKIEESVESATQSIEDQKNEQIAAASAIETHKKELYKLEEQLKSEKASQEEVNEASERYREVAAELEEKIPGITNYLFDETGEIWLQKDAVDELCKSYYDLIVAKAKLAAAEETIKEHQKAIIELEDLQDEASKTQTETRKKAADAGIIIDIETAEVTKKGNGILDHMLAFAAEAQYKDARNTYQEVPGQIKEHETEIENLRKTIMEGHEYIAELEADLEAKGIGVDDEETGDRTRGTGGSGGKSTTRDQQKQELSDLKQFYSESAQADEEYYQKLEEHRDKHFKIGTQEWHEFNEDIGQIRRKNLENSLAMEEISEAQFYNELEDIRDKYFQSGSDGWKEYTEDLYAFQKEQAERYVDLLNEEKAAADDMLEDLKEKQQNIADGLKTNTSMFQFGTINGESFVNLTNYDQENVKLEKYGQLLDELFEKRPELPNSILAELQSMDVDQGIKAVEALLRVSDSQYNSMLKGYSLREENAKKVSSGLISEDVDEFKNILESKFGQLPEEFFSIGEDSIEFFGKGLLDGLDELMQEVRDSIYAEMSVLSAGAIAFNSAGGDSSSVVNNYNNSYSIGSSKESVTEQLSSIKAYEILNRMRDIK